MFNNLIRKVTAAGVVSTLAGSTTGGHDNGTGTAATFGWPTGVAVDGSGTVYVADTMNNMIRKITPAGEVSTLAGSSTMGQADGIGSAATFNKPFGIAVDAAGTIFVADEGNSLIRKITPIGEVSTLAGSTASGNTDGTGTAASFNHPTGVAVDASGNVYVADTNNNLIRKITPAGVVSTLAGSTISGHADGTGTAASFCEPRGIAVDASGTVYVSDSGNNLFRSITPAGVVSTHAGLTRKGHADGTGAAASFFNPGAIAIDASGAVYMADTSNNMIRKLIK
jgi:sugar lactone lactonase YvrE